MTEDLTGRHQVEAELDQLRTRVAALDEYFCSQDANGISGQMRSLMRRQQELMLCYRHVLEARLAIWDQ